MKTLIVGMGEVGRAHYNLLSKVYPVAGYDTKTGWEGDDRGFFDIIHIATPWLGDKFVPMVEDYARRHRPKHISVLTTVPPGTCRAIEDATGLPTCHSTTRGLHPNLERGLQNITKHVGGKRSEALGNYFKAAGISSIFHNRAETTEVAHLLINIDYAVALAFADEKARICREFGVDYVEAVMAYTRTYNHGFVALDHSSKVRPVLTPPNGRIGGHCLVQNAQMLAPVLKAAGVKAPLVEMVARYNDR